MSRTTLSAALLLPMLGCQDTEVDDTGGGSGPPLEQGVDGTVALDDDWCSYPDSVDIYRAKAGESACDWAPEFDTGWSDTGHWTDHVGEQVASPFVSSVGEFQSALEVGHYEVRVFDECFGCTDFSVAEDAVTDVELALREVIYADAPNLYLYPRSPTAVSVRLADARHIVAADPDYGPSGWQVLALPDGQLLTARGVDRYLFYELRTPSDRLQRDAGWCVEGALAQASVEGALADAGFRSDEIADFGDAWDANWPRAEWMTVYPQTRGLGGLRIQPRPDALLRLWFVIEDGCAPNLEVAALPEVERVGFHAAEWGVVFDRAYPRDWDLVE